eukprot:CAMPEP_0197534216 /NCGR_PEP_ID=MMETSP1318-20131121/46364_1 /TAXON_ID=552666 /ORGANISM="Partenskyella glossopodia, Strain RCC365" /LENGTH=186 /DNA_ID=CAMNT_0043091399 /DNA_START=174 /DNA_END=734 /DNA_ORIENTATION=-
MGASHCYINGKCFRCSHIEKTDTTNEDNALKHLDDNGSDNNDALMENDIDSENEPSPEPHSEEQASQISRLKENGSQEMLNTSEKLSKEYEDQNQNSDDYLDTQFDEGHHVDDGNEYQEVGNEFPSPDSLVAEVEISSHKSDNFEEPPTPAMDDALKDPVSNADDDHDEDIHSMEDYDDDDFADDR